MCAFRCPPETLLRPLVRGRHNNISSRRSVVGGGGTGSGGLFGKFANATTTTAATVAASTFTSSPSPLLLSATRAAAAAAAATTTKTKTKTKTVEKKSASSTAASTIAQPRAATVTALGKPLEICTQPKQRDCTAGQVRVRVAHAAVNFADLLMARGEYQVKLNPPFVAGSELSGYVSEIGPGVKNCKVGDRVVAMPPAGGAFADECLCPAAATFSVPHGLSLASAAATAVSYGTAHMALLRRGQLKSTDTILVTAGAGAVGLAAVDIAKHMVGAKRVIAAVGSAAKEDVCRAAGADHTINYTREDIRDRVLDITDGSGANVVIESVGGAIFDACLRSIAWEGRLVVVGFAGGTIPQIPANRLLVKNVSAVGVYWGAYAQNDPQLFAESLKETFGAAASGVLSPTVGANFPLKDVNAAFDYIRARKSTGKVILDCAAAAAAADS